MANVEQSLNRCPYCGRFVGVDPDGYYDTAERGADPETAYVTAFCDKAHADKFHNRKPETENAHG
jgi:hypothetical protein